VYHITRYTRIINNQAFSGDELLFKAATVSFTDFSDNIYKYLNPAYPKFHKMDNLCKLGFLGAEILLKDNTLSLKYDPYDIGVILSNKSSSLDTDFRHHQQVKAGLPSPAVFVYSLPNIVIGEICIRHGIKGENVFFINNEYNIPEQVDYITELFETGVVKTCIGGWVELLGEDYDLFLYLVESNQNQKGVPFTTNHIEKLYTHI
jgi:hypothetical protein